MRHDGKGQRPASLGSDAVPYFLFDLQTVGLLALYDNSSLRTQPFWLGQANDWDFAQRREETIPAFNP